MKHIKSITVAKAQIDATGILTLLRAILDIVLGFIGGKEPAAA